MQQVWRLSWMKWQKGTTGSPTKENLHLLPIPLFHVMTAAPSKNVCQWKLCSLSRMMVKLSMTKTLGAVSWMRVLRLICMRNFSVPVKLPSLWAIWPVPSWPRLGWRLMWWNKVTWGSWSGTTRDILSSEQGVTLGRADSSGTRARRSSWQRRSLLAKLRCLGRANKGL